MMVEVSSSLELPLLEVEIDIETASQGFDPSEVLLNLLLQYLKARTIRNSALSVLELEELLCDVYDHYTSLGYSVETLETCRCKVGTSVENVKIRKVYYVYPRGSKYVLKIEYVARSDIVEKLKIEKMKIEDVYLELDF